MEQTVTSKYFTRSSSNANHLRRRFLKIEENTNQIYSKKIKVEQTTSALEQKPTWYPENWELLLKNIKDMRGDRTAVVDSQGCERTADPKETPRIKRFQTLISLMLSSQTKDQITFSAMNKLKEYGCNSDSLMNASEEKIGQLIYPVGFWKTKSKHLKEAAGICHTKFDGDIPDSIVGLKSLPGVGPKMAYICMSAAWGKVDGIGVDTHVHRIANRLKFVKSPTKTPEKTRKALEEWLPVDEWKDINILLVGFGQQTCLPVHPRCSGCLNKDICPSAYKKKVKVKKEEKKGQTI